MFCSKCGHNLAGNVAAFCPNCGAAVTRDFQQTLPQAQTPGPLKPSEAKGFGASPGSIKMRGILAALSLLMVATMLLGWLSIRAEGPGGVDIIEEIMWDLANVRMRDANAADLGQSITVYGLNNTVNTARRLINVAESVMLADSWASARDIENFNTATQPVRTAAMGVNIVGFAMLISIAALALFVLFSASEMKAAHAIGMAASVFAFLTALIFIIAVAVINAIVGDAINLAAAGFFRLNLSATIWVWLTMIFAIINFALIAFNKNKGGI